MLEFAWEFFQTLFMIGTLVTVMVNTSSIKRLTNRIFRAERRLWPNVKERMESRHD